MRFDNIIIFPATTAGFSPNRWMTARSFDVPGSTIASGTPSLQQAATPQSIVSTPGGCLLRSMVPHSRNIFSSTRRTASVCRIVAAQRISGSNFKAVRRILAISASVSNPQVPAALTVFPCTTSPPATAATPVLSRAPVMA